MLKLMEFKCNNKRCKLCKLYLQECKSFTTSNGFKWEIKCNISCNSRNVIYFLICNFCNHVSNVGKTDILRDRTNNHITACRNGKSSDIFDNHVHNCAIEKNLELKEPYFKLYVFLKLNNYSNLRNYEKMFHSRGYDTINK